MAPSGASGLAGTKGRREEPDAITQARLVRGLSLLSPADFGKFIAAETEKWAKVIRTANIKPE